MLGKHFLQISLKFLSTSIIHYTSCAFWEALFTMDKTMELYTITFIKIFYREKLKILYFYSTLQCQNNTAMQNRGFSDVFREYRSEALVENGLREFKRIN